MSESYGKTYSSVKEMFDDMDREWKEKEPLSYWIDHSLFKGSRLAKLLPYAPNYSLTHPHKVIAHYWQELVYAWQRATRGWDDTVVWSIDSWLADIMPKIMTELKSYNSGTPVEFFEGKEQITDKRGLLTYSKEDEEEADRLWNIELQKIIDGFVAAKKIIDYEPADEKEQEALMKIFNEGMDSFKEHFFSLWD